MAWAQEDVASGKFLKLQSYSLITYFFFFANIVPGLWHSQNLLMIPVGLLVVVIFLQWQPTKPAKDIFVEQLCSLVF